MAEDPFAAIPDPAEAEPEVPEEAPRTETGPPAEPGEYYPYKVSLKAGDGYDAPWFTAQYRTLEEAHRELTDVDSRTLFGQVLESVTKMNAYFLSKGPGVTRKTGGASSGPGPKKADPAEAEPPSWAPPPDCPHGAVYKTAQRKDKKGYWHKYVCPNDDCADQWLNQPKGR